MHRFLRVFMLFAMMALVARAATAQGTGTIAGKVTDETGGVLPGVGIVLTRTGTQTSAETVTDGAGTYRFDNVQAGPAELTFRLINFSTVRRAITVNAGTAVAADALMLVAASADIVITAPRTFRNLAEIDNPAE